MSKINKADDCQNLVQRGTNLFTLDCSEVAKIRKWPMKNLVLFVTSYAFAKPTVCLLFVGLEKSFMLMFEISMTKG